MQRTIDLEKFKHINIVINYQLDGILEEDIDLFYNYICKSVSEGVKYKNGQTLQLGWNILQFFQLDNELISLKELDMTGIPSQYSPEITNTIKYLRQQKDSLESLDTNEEINFPSIIQSVIVCNNFYNTKDFFITRDIPNDRDSGWFFGCSDPNHNHNLIENISLDSLYVSSCKRKSLIKYLALPIGWTLIFKDNKREKILNRTGNEVKIIKGSYLDMAEY